MSFELTILGCGSATPTSKQHPTAQQFASAERFFLIDCVEGTQQQLRKYKLRLSKINRIFISDLHLFLPSTSPTPFSIPPFSPFQLFIPIPFRLP